MTMPRTLAALLVLSTLAAPALAQGVGGSDNTNPSPAPAAGQPAAGNQGVSGQGPSSNPQPSASSGTPNVTANAGSRPGVARNPTAVVQDQLQQLGLYKGDIDGKWGPQTRDALLDFQRSHHLRPTGTLNAATVALLSQATQANNANQEPTPPEAGMAGNNTAPPTPPAPRRPSASTIPGFATSPGNSTAPRVTAAAPGMGFGQNPMPGSNTAPGIGAGNNGGRDFFGYNLDLSNGFNAAIGQGR